MKNWRRIVVTGLIAGMVAFTGCSSNVPDTNQGNRNGQRVVDAVNNRSDSYSTTRGRTTETRRTDGIRGHRGINRSARRAVRNEVRTETGSRNITGHNRPVTRSAGTHTRNAGTHRAPNHTTRNHATRNHATRNHGYNRHHGRVGHTFGYGHYGYNDAIDWEASNYGAGGYDYGQRASTRSNTPTARPFNPAGVNTGINNRVVRSTPATTRPSAPKAATHKATTGTSTVTRSAPKSTTGTTRNTTTRSTATPRPTATIAPKVAPKPVAPKPKPAIPARQATPQAPITRSARPATPSTNVANNPTNQVSERPRAQENRVIAPIAANNSTSTRSANAIRNTSNGGAANRDGRSAFVPRPPRHRAARAKSRVARANNAATVRNSRDGVRERSYNVATHQMIDINNPVISNLNSNISRTASATRNQSSSPRRTSNARHNDMAINYTADNDTNRMQVSTTRNAGRIALNSVASDFNAIGNVAQLNYASPDISHAYDTQTVDNTSYAGLMGTNELYASNTHSNDDSYYSHGDDDNYAHNDYAFFRRNRTDETEATPTPESPEATPDADSSTNDDNIHDTDHDDAHGADVTQLMPNRDGLDNQTAPARRTTRRAMK